MSGGEITLAQLEQSFEHAARSIDTAVAKVVQRTAGKVATTQRQNVPKRSRRTEKSIKATGPGGKPFTPTTDEAEVGPSWYVGRFIETGTPSYPTPRPFVSTSYEPHADAHEREIQQAELDGFLRGL